jgi:hypothetical protein
LFFLLILSFHYTFASLNFRHLDASKVKKTTGKEYKHQTKQISKMKKMVMITLMLVGMFTAAHAQGKAEIKFDKQVINIGTFPETAAKKSVTFTFTNIGEAPLVINQVVASCGCTSPQYDKKPIAPGQKGSIKVTYDGAGKFPGYFKKSITVRTNATTEMTRLYIEGTMTE